MDGPQRSGRAGLECRLSAVRGLNSPAHGVVWSALEGVLLKSMRRMEDMRICRLLVPWYGSVAYRSSIGLRTRRYVVYWYCMDQLLLLCGLTMVWSGPHPP